MVDFMSSLFGNTPGVRSHAPGFLEGVVSDVLQPLLGNFVRGLDRDHLKMSIWDGELLLRDLELKTELLDALPVPFRVLGGTIGEIRVSVPWRRLGSEPMLVSIDRLLLLVVARTGDAAEEPDENVKAEGKRALAEAAEAVEEQNAAGEEMGQTMVDRLVAALLQKIQVSITNVHVRIQGGIESDALAGGAMIRSIRIDDPPMDPKGRRPEARAGVEQELSRKRLSIDGLAVYLDTTASIETVVPPMDEASGHAASSSSSAAAAPGLPGRGHGDCMAEWEARMLAMISLLSCVMDHPPFCGLHCCCCCCCCYCCRCCRCCYRSSRTRSTPHALSSTSTSRTSSRYA